MSDDKVFFYLAKGTPVIFVKELSNWEESVGRMPVSHLQADDVYSEDSVIFYPTEPGKEPSALCLRKPNVSEKLRMAAIGVYGFRVGSWAMLVSQHFVHNTPLDKPLDDDVQGVDGVVDGLRVERWVDSLQYVLAEVKQSFAKSSRQLNPLQAVLFVRAIEVLKKSIELLRQLEKEKQ